MINFDKILNKVFSETKKNNNYSTLIAWTIHKDHIICYLKEYKMIYKFHFSPKCLTIYDHNAIYNEIVVEGKEFPYTDERVLNELLTLLMYKESDVIKQYYENLKTKVILSLL